MHILKFFYAPENVIENVKFYKRFVSSYKLFITHCSYPILLTVHSLH